MADFWPNWAQPSTVLAAVSPAQGTRQLMTVPLGLFGSHERLPPRRSAVGRRLRSDSPRLLGTTFLGAQASTSWALRIFAVCVSCQLTQGLLGATRAGADAAPALGS